MSSFRLVWARAAGTMSQLASLPWRISCENSGQPENTREIGTYPHYLSWNFLSLIASIQGLLPGAFHNPGTQCLSRDFVLAILLYLHTCILIYTFSYITLFYTLSRIWYTFFYLVNLRYLYLCRVSHRGSNRKYVILIKVVLRIRILSDPHIFLGSGSAF